MNLADCTQQLNKTDKTITYSKQAAQLISLSPNAHSTTSVLYKSASTKEGLCYRQQPQSLALEERPLLGVESNSDITRTGYQSHPKTASFFFAS